MASRMVPRNRLTAALPALAIDPLAAGLRALILLLTCLLQQKTIYVMKKGHIIYQTATPPVP